MKSLRELQAIRDKMKSTVEMRGSSEGKVRILVGMATCGIAAGARPVLNAFNEEIIKRDLSDKVIVSQTGCIGICQYEPVAEVVEGDKKTTYVKLDPEKAKRIVIEHIIGKSPVTEYTIGAVK
jgi:NADP-reducing hydrogenase subunit HndB